MSGAVSQTQVADLAGAGAVVAGGASGLGEATARAIVDRGGRVAIVDQNDERAHQVAHELGDSAVALVADVTDEEQIRRAVADASESIGPLRAVAACAGVGWAERVVSKRGPANLELFEKVVRINLIGTYNILRLAVGKMAANEPDEHGQRGAVVMTASAAAFDGQIGQTAYAASKGGVVSLTLPAARDLGSLGIRVCTIAPGLFDTPLMRLLPDDQREDLAKNIVFPKRLGEPAEFARLACELLTNPYINGETVRLDGALRMPPR
jgi:NAD(P)-dependent dehydrogenase (short-subunit alcohol dehydrogenase family)